MKIAIIGDGIAGKCVHKYLGLKQRSFCIKRFGSDSFVRSCSTRTTSINCLRGTQKGISDLGDTIVDSFDVWEKYYKEHLPKGVYKTFEYQLWENEGSQFFKRYGKNFSKVSQIDGIELTRDFYSAQNLAYLIDPDTFFESMKLPRAVNELVTELIRKDNSYILKTSSGKVEKFDCIFLCTSRFSHLFTDLFENKDSIDFVKRSKPVKGDYLVYKAKEILRPKSIVFCKDHLIFRENSILLGSTSHNNQASEKPVKEELRELYKRVGSQINYKLPPFEHFSMVTGIRCKGRKRRPYWGEVGPHLFLISGLYKNAFTFAFKAASDLTKTF